MAGSGAVRVRIVAGAVTMALVVSYLLWLRARDEVIEPTTMITYPTRTVPTITAGSGPTGGRIVYESHRDGDSEVYVLDLDSRTEQQVTNNTHFDRGPR